MWPVIPTASHVRPLEPCLPHQGARVEGVRAPADSSCGWPAGLQDRLEQQGPSAQGAPEGLEMLDWPGAST